MVHQEYECYVEMEHAVLGNDALFRCKIPSHVADLVSVVGWVDSGGGSMAGQGNLGDREEGGLNLLLLLLVFKVTIISLQLCLHHPF